MACIAASAKREKAGSDTSRCRLELFESIVGAGECITQDRYATSRIRVSKYFGRDAANGAGIEQRGLRSRRSSLGSRLPRASSGVGVSHRTSPLLHLPTALHPVTRSSPLLQRPHFVPLLEVLWREPYREGGCRSLGCELERCRVGRPPVARRQPRDGTQNHAIRAICADLSVAAELVRAHREVGKLRVGLAPAFDTSSATKLAAGLSGLLAYGPPREAQEDEATRTARADHHVETGRRPRHLTTQCATI